ncbi:MAG: lysylphosphatidylglycerol synthase transmembrane domain-containing protein, partial [candidate division Zixibacteria bacterium]
MLMFLKNKQFWGGLTAIALLAICLNGVELEEIKQLSKRLDFIWLIPATIASALFQIFRGLRWRLIISQQTPMPLVQGISLYSAGQVLNIVMPVLTGQVGRMILFARKANLRKTVVFSTIVMEIVFDAAGLIIFLLLTSVAFAIPSNYRSVSYMLVAVTVAMLATLYLILHYQLQLEEVGRKHMRSRWPGVYITLKKFLRSFIKGIDLLRSSQHVVGSLAYSLISWIFHVLAVYFLFLAFGFDLPFAVAAAVMIINTIVLMVPITPGNAGTFEIAVSTSLTAFSIGRSDAVLFAMALHLIDLLPIMALGLTYVHYQKISLSEIKRQHSEEVIFDKISEDGTLI